MNIVLYYQATQRHLDQIRQAAPGASVSVADGESLPQLLMEADIFFGHAKVAVDWSQIVESGRLGWIQSSAAGLDHCLTPSVKSSEILVSSASGLFADQVAEQAMALLLGLIRRMNLFFRAQLVRHYQRLATDDLHGKKIVIIGAGGNGQRIAQVLRPFRPQISATDCFHDQKLDDIDRLVPPHALLEVLSESEIAIVTLPLTEQTRCLFGDQEFAALPAGSYLINVGRGEVVDERALIAALQRGHLAGAGLDVVELEPLPATSKLWDFDNVLITPHVGAQSKSRIDDVTNLFCENLQRYRQRQRLINQVDKKLGFPRPEDRFQTRFSS